MASKKFMIIVWALAALIFRLAIATDHTIGGPSGWTISTDAQTWAASQTFSVGDNLLFSYPSAFHDVVEVSKPEFDSCQATKPLATFSNGNTIVPLTSPGKRYFICGSPGHCKQGMKLEVNVLAAANAAIPAAPEASAPQPLTPSSLPSAGISPLPPIARPQPPSALPSALSPQPLLPISPGILPALSPSASPPLPKVSPSLPLIPTAQPPETSSAATSLPLAPGSSASSSGGASKTVGNLPVGSGTANNLGSSQTPADSSEASKTFVLGFGFVLVMIFHMF